MNCFWTWLLIGASATVLAQKHAPAKTQDMDVMVVAVSRDDSVLAGGISSGRLASPGKINVEILALLSSSGEWKGHPCAKSYGKICLNFAHQYLSKPHKYVVISADGLGATVQAEPVKLSECYDYAGLGTYGGTPIAASAIAASSADFFSGSTPPQLLGNQAAKPIRMALGRLVPLRVDSVERLRIFSVRLEGQDFLILQRSFSDFVDVAANRYAYVFTIGTMVNGQFHILHSKKNTEDEQERILGTIRMKDGREFLITSVNDPESHSFRVYGLVAGQLVLLYSGGGSSC